MKLKSKRTHAGPKVAGIYIRVSSEDQAEGINANPKTHEADARRLCQDNSYSIYKVYYDLERYKVGSRYFEPSAKYSHRPGFQEWLKDAYAGKIDVLVAWREDRLYREYDPMNDVAKCLNATGLEIKLVTETFNPDLMGVKCNMSKLELQSRHVRQVSGMQGRLARGKLLNGRAPLGYRLEKHTRDAKTHQITAINPLEGTFTLVPGEVEVVRLIWTRYAEGKHLSEIRQELLDSGAQQKISESNKWHASTIVDCLKHDYYYTGQFITHTERGDRTTTIPTIISPELAARVNARMAMWANVSGKRRGAVGGRGQKHIRLASGLLFCGACGRRLRTLQRTDKRRKHGKYYTQYLYVCPNVNEVDGTPQPGCCKSVSCDLVDNAIWQNLAQTLTMPGVLESKVLNQLSELKEQEQRGDVISNKRIEQELKDLEHKRLNIVRQQVNGKISEEQQDILLSEVAIEQAKLEHLREQNEFSNVSLADRAYQQFIRYRDTNCREIEDLTAADVNDKQVQERKRQKALEIVQRINLNSNKQPAISISIPWGIRPQDMPSLPTGEWFMAKQGEVTTEQGPTVKTTRMVSG